MKARVITAIFIILVCAIPVAFGGLPLEILALFILAAGGYEWTHAQKDHSIWPKWLLIVLIGFVLLSRFVPNHYAVAYYAMVVIVLWSLNVFFESISIPDVQSFILYFMIFSLVYRSIGYIQEEHRYLIMICFATYASDTGAWFFGRKLGKHKMNPRISPKKSWEGFVGGWITGFLLSFVYSVCFLQGMPLVLNMGIALLCPVFAELGDLCFSSIKRYYGIKDFSDLLPGHGGVLDRVDSLLMNLLVFLILHSFV